MPQDAAPKTFEEYVSDWDKLVGQINALKKQLKPLTDAEMPMRRAIFAAVETALKQAGTWKEGMNSYPMVDGRKLKVGNNIKREIEVSMIAVAREAFAKQNDVSVTFDELLRTKYELEKKEWNKLSDEAKRVVSVMIAAKPDTPEVTLD